MKRREFEYEIAADVPNFIHLWSHPDMKAEGYRFWGMHIHQSSEVVFVYDGALRVTVNDESRLLGPGEIFIANSYDLHYYEYVGNASAYILVIGKEFIDGILKEDQEFAHFIAPGKETFETILGILASAYKKGESINLLQKRGLVYSVFGELDSASLYQEKRSSSNAELLVSIFDYIADHYKETINLTVIAKAFGYSNNYLSTFFNKTVGTHFSDYVNNYRATKVLERKEKEKSTPMKTIIQECGFTSAETFYRTLRNRSGKKN